MNIHNFWSAVLAQDPERLAEYFVEGASVNWHCTNEHFTAEEYIRANCEYPGDWDGTVERVVSSGDQIITAAHVFAKDGSISCHVVSFLQVKDGKITAMDEYWADDGPPPMWRQEKKLGTPIR